MVTRLNNYFSHHVTKVASVVQRKKVKIISTIFAFTITTFILGWLIYSNWSLFTDHSWKIRAEYLVLAFLVYCSILGLTVFTWARIIEQFGPKIRFPIHFRAFCISALGKRLPGTLWYIAWRSQMYQRVFSIKAITVASGVEMAIIVIAASIVSIFFSISHLLYTGINLVLIVSLLLLSLLLIHPRLIAFVLQRLKVNAEEFRYSDLLKWIAIYLAIWVLNGVLLYAISNMFFRSPIIDLPHFISTTAMTGVLSRLLLFSPSMFGFTEVSISLLLSRIMPAPFAVVVAISFRIIVIAFELIWALCSILIEKRSNRINLATILKSDNHLSS